MVGIKNYQGTKAQNMKIQAYLLAHGRIPRVATQTSAKTLSASEYQQISHSSVSYIATAVR